MRDAEKLQPEFDRLCVIEPRLRQLERAIREHAAAHKHDKIYCANSAWYGHYRAPGFKERLVQLVGWEADRDELVSGDVYDTAYEFCYQLLPNCRNCNCM